MVGDEIHRLLVEARREKSAGHYDRAIAAYSSVAGAAADLLTAWQSVEGPSDAVRAVTPALAAALRELEISRLDVEAARSELGAVAAVYRGFAPLDPAVFEEVPLGRALAVAILTAADRQTPRPLLHAAFELIAEDIEAGLIDAERFLAIPALRPLHASLHLIAGRNALAADAADEALRHAGLALSTAPCLGPAYRLMGEAQLRLGDGIASARSFDLAAAFWNPNAWSSEFPPGARCQVPGITIKGFDIIHLGDEFVAVPIPLYWRYLVDIARTLAIWLYRSLLMMRARLIDIRARARQIRVARLPLLKQRQRAHSTTREQPAARPEQGNPVGQGQSRSDRLTGTLALLEMKLFRIRARAKTLSRLLDDLEGE